jgi:hypothetical protein
MIKIKNKRTYKGKGEYVGRPSPLGNPFAFVGPDKNCNSREEAIALYEKWLDENIKIDGPVKKKFDSLVEDYNTYGELTLICWCSPKSCHAEVIKRKIENANHETKKE